jgi:hypothetical protein
MEMMRQKDSLRACQGKVSGPMVVFSLFAGAFLLFGIAFYIAYQQKTSSQAAIAAMNPPEFSDSAKTIETMRHWFSDIPPEWVKVTAIEGQGLVVFVPCYSANPEMILKSGPDSLPSLDCENCDSVGEYRIESMARVRADSSLELRLKPKSGQLRIIPLTDSLLQKYPGAPFRDKQIIWIRSNEAGKSDTSIFVPKSLAGEFETLRAEDENPEGCGTEPAD